MYIKILFKIYDLIFYRFIINFCWFIYDNLLDVFIELFSFYLFFIIIIFCELEYNYFLIIFIKIVKFIEMKRLLDIGEDKIY